MKKKATVIIMGLALILSVVGPSYSNNDTLTIIVNGVRLNDQQILALEQVFVGLYRQYIPSGRYWYDPISGYMGIEGTPPLLQFFPNLKLGGRLKPNASKGNTQIFINGRELHQQEVVNFVQFCGVPYPLPPGRYWMNAQMTGGIEGNLSPLFNLLTLCPPAMIAQNHPQNRPQTYTQQNHTQNYRGHWRDSWISNSDDGHGIIYNSLIGNVDY